ncbi:uncharacterized protein LOC106873504 [Octopus bimaculoides]|uniref:Uncharacterized protein n=1 Tax=Octopus bimaculoides TaxID=37653 RepID=A0A0L8H0Z5_OCTBM|nr:uncharacterized protein LOC106873504 [Octopus bimaculoides]|eukprot:XP_014776375.1 PREDICTED: uncharacterized protein LOC106873504 [Octopus bimaculoides]
MDVKKNCSMKTPHSENDSSAEEHLQKTPKKSVSSEGCRSSERRRNKPEFSMPKRSDVWDNIKDMPTKGMGSLIPRKIVNDFVVNNYRYNHDPNYTSGEESAFVESAEESDGFTKAKTKQQKAIKKRIKNSSKRQQKGSDSSESFDSSEESVMKAKKLILKKVHTKNSAKKPLSESLESSDNSDNAIVKSALRIRKVISSGSDSTESQEKIAKAAQISLISKRKKAPQALQSSSSSVSDSEVAGGRGDKSKMERDEKAKMLSVMNKSVKHSHFKWGSSEEEDKEKIVSITKKARNAGTISSEWSGSVSDVCVEDSSENSISDRDFICKDLPTATGSAKTTGKNSDK